MHIHPSLTRRREHRPRGTQHGCGIAFMTFDCSPGSVDFVVVGALAAGANPAWTARGGQKPIAGVMMMNPVRHPSKVTGSPQPDRGILAIR
jgi:hypothetical protein